MNITPRNSFLKNIFRREKICPSESRCKRSGGYMRGRLPGPSRVVGRSASHPRRRSSVSRRVTRGIASLPGRHRPREAPPRAGQVTKGARQRVEGRHRGGRPGPIQGQASCRGARPLRSGPGSGLRLTGALGVPGAAAGGSGAALPPCCPPGGAPGSFVAGARGGFLSPRGGANSEETGGREGGWRAREPRRTGRGGAADF